MEPEDKHLKRYSSCSCNDMLLLGFMEMGWADDKGRIMQP